MPNFEYKVVPAPNQGTKAKGVKTTEDRFALTLTDALNEMADDGWDYVRAETLPCEARKGLTGTQTTYQNVLIFRRLVGRPDRMTQEDGASAPLPPLTLGSQPARREPAVSRPAPAPAPTSELMPDASDLHRD